MDICIQKKKPTKNISTSLGALRGGHQLEVDNWHYLCSFYKIWCFKRWVSSLLNSIGKLVSTTAKSVAKITPQSKEFHINSFKNAVAHPVSQLDTVWQFNFTQKVKGQKY